MKKIIEFILDLFRSNKATLHYEELATSKEIVKEVHIPKLFIWCLVPGYSAKSITLHLDKDITFENVGRNVDTGIHYEINELPDYIDYTIELTSDTDTIIKHSTIPVENNLIGGNVVYQITERKLELLPISFDAVVKDVKEIN